MKWSPFHTKVLFPTERLNAQVLGVSGSYLVFCAFVGGGGVKTPPLCPFFLSTGLECPLCGMTRSWGSLMFGNLEAAWSYNKAATILFLPALFLVSLMLVRWIKNLNSKKVPNAPN